VKTVNFLYDQQELISHLKANANGTVNNFPEITAVYICNQHSFICTAVQYTNTPPPFFLPKEFQSKV
jgi:hypothetical protein